MKTHPTLTGWVRKSYNQLRMPKGGVAYAANTFSSATSAGSSAVSSLPRFEMPR